MKHTYTVKAYIDSKYVEVASVRKGVVRPQLASESMANYYEENGYAHIGDAQVTLELFDDKTVVTKQMEGLKQQLKVVRAQNKVRENSILDQISNLQALTYEPA